MYRLYAGTGTISDNSGGSRAIAVTASISDVLLHWTGLTPVVVTPGTALPSAQYAYAVAAWTISVEGIGIFFGSRGHVYIELAVGNQLGDTMWLFDSEAGPSYGWGGQIAAFDDPTNQNWPLPTNPGFAQLPRFIRCGIGALGASIQPLANRPDGSSSMQFTLTRVS